jgi:hypothetical protein
MSDFLFNGKVVKPFTDEDLNFTNDLVKMTLTLDNNGYEIYMKPEEYEKLLKDMNNDRKRANND